MSSMFRHTIITSFISILSLPIYAENLTTVDATKDQSDFLQNLNASVEAPIGATTNKSGATSPTNLATPTTANDSTTTTAKIQQLQAMQAQLQIILDTMQIQTKQLEIHLPVLKQQLEKAQALQGLPNETLESKQQLQQLLSEYQKMQTNLTNMMQQQIQLQTDMSVSNQQLTQLQQSLIKLTTVAKTSQPSTLLNVSASPQIPSPDQTKTATTDSATSVPSKTTMVPINISSPHINGIEEPVVSAATSTLTANMPILSDMSTPTSTTNETSSTSSPTSSVSSATTWVKSVANTPVSIPLKVASDINTETNQSDVSTQKKSTTSLITWIQDPAILFRTGLLFIGLALLFILIFFWPKQNRQKNITLNIQPIKSAPKTEFDTSLSTQDDELTSDYDFMNTQEAIPARLDLARGYIEMNKYEEAKEAIAPVFETGNDQQKAEAQQLLETINKTSSHFQ